MPFASTVAVCSICYKLLSFRSNRSAGIITGQFVKPRLPYTSYFRLKAHMLRLISGASERSFPVLLRPLSLQMRKWSNFFLSEAEIIGRLFS